MKVAVAMSGGVDSSVAAHILKEQGHEVIGLTMKIWPCGTDAQGGGRTCCDPDSIRDAERVAGELGIRHYELGMRGAFEGAVVREFLAEYASGRTPNPCVTCNRLIKFGPFLEKAVALGATHLATGHHAVVARDEPAGAYLLRKGRDRSKDQSYFLYVLKQKQLSHVLMPIGGMTKTEVRDAARAAGLSIAERPESQDVCFVPDGDVAAFFRLMMPEAMRPGPIEDVDGNVLGEHGGIALYTVGQRSGLGLSRPRPTYVLRLDAARNAIVVGDDEELYSSELTASDLNWIAGAPPAAEFRTEAKIRYGASPCPCAAELEGERLRLRFEEPKRAITPGQSVVLYDGETVLGGGVIDC
ncbi:tRNA 2-thiouridine(34) synthase MnmA [bacterium]|nr:tRNA 2-thiouridine(34) synthase MnmA [bacterium]